MPEGDDRHQPVDRQGLARILRTALEFRMQNDVRGMLQQATPDIVYRGDGWKNYRSMAPVRGKEACAQMIWAIFIEYENLGTVVHKSVFEADRVAFRRTATLRKRGTAKSAEVDICCFVRFRGDCVAEISEYFDTRQMLELDT